MTAPPPPTIAPTAPPAPTLPPTTTTTTTTTTTSSSTTDLVHLAPKIKTYYIGSKDEACPKPVTTSEECQKASQSLSGRWDGDRNWGDRCFGCLWTTGDKDVNFNSNSGGNCGQNSDQQTVCIKEETSSAPSSGTLLVTYGGWEFYKVETSDTSDDGIISACTEAGLVTPCAGNDNS